MSKKQQDVRTCGNCAAPDGQDETTLKPCGRCRLVFYCNKACQAQHWKATHRVGCIALADRKPEIVAAAKETVLSSLDCWTDVKCSFCLGKVSRATMSTLPCEHSFHETCLASDKSNHCILCTKPYKSIQEIYKTKPSAEAMKRFVELLETRDDFTEDSEPIVQLKVYVSEMVDAVNLGSVNAAIEFVDVFKTSPMKELMLESMAFRVFERDTSFRLTKLALLFLGRKRDEDPNFHKNCLQRLVRFIPPEALDTLVEDFFYDSELHIACQRDLLETVLDMKPYVNDRYFLKHADAIHALATLMDERNSATEKSETVKLFSLAADRYELCIKRLVLTDSDKIDVFEGLCLSLASSKQKKRAKMYARKLLELDSVNEIGQSIC